MGNRTVPGQRYGRFTVICEQGHYGAALAYLCRCDCGEERVVPGTKLRDGGWASCGCAKLPNHAAVVVTHGHARHGHSGDGRTPTYVSWRKARDRCRNPNSQNWAFYGARGVTVCERWDSFENFLADMGERPDGMTLDRIDPAGNYEPGNCRWATPAQQARNKRRRRCGSIRLSLSSDVLDRAEAIGEQTGRSQAEVLAGALDAVFSVGVA